MEKDAPQEKTQPRSSTILVLIVVGLGLIGFLGRDILVQSEQAQSEDAPVAEMSEAAADGAVEDSPAPEPEAEPSAPSNDTDAPSAAQEPETEIQIQPEPEAASIPAPTFDIVRIEPTGSVLIAGRGSPRATIEVMVDEQGVAATQAGPTGSFVIVFDLAPSDKPRVLSLAMRPEGSDEIILSDSTVFVAPDTVLVQDQGGEDGEDGQAAEQATPQDAPLPSIIVSEDNQVSVVPDGDLAQAGQATLDSVTYDDEGGINLSGRAPGGASVLLYLDNLKVSEGTIDADENWRAQLPSTTLPDMYELRVDVLGADGAVVSRLVTPFEREQADTVSNVLSNLERTGEGMEVRVIEPGATLWAIARERYGEGRLYVKIFDANRSSIRDPDLIYPGQVFTIPE